MSRHFLAGLASPADEAVGPDGTLREAWAPLGPVLERITAPVLLAHGDRDTNVPVAESVQAHQELQARGGTSELLLLPGEGHTVVGREHLVELSAAVVAWFDRWL